MNKLSVIIVNYNVQYFLEQALLAVNRAAEGMAVEVWVVDNASTDGSVEMVRAKFSHVNCIANVRNVGFSTANNQAIALSKAEYILLLNPDTVVAEDTFARCVAFMDSRQDVGGLGVKMIDGTGQFLPESKRGFPSPAVAFYKTFGLGKIFSRSPRFNRYYLGHLSKDENCEADVLSGAFMLMRKAALDKVGYLDEAFFMYGEDIDLSYRIVLGGWKNYYLADTAIIHYKGESTKRGSLNYVKTFYQAMIIFTRKHFVGRMAGLFVLMLRAGIYFRAGITLAANFWRALAMPLADAAAMYGGLFLLKNIWAVAHFKDAEYFPDTLLYINFPLYIAVWLCCVYLRGGYDAGARYRQLWGGIIAGTLVVAAIYGLLPDDLRYSRMLIVLGGIWAMLGATVLRMALRVWRHKSIFSAVSERARNTIIVGGVGEAKRVLQLLHDVQADFTYLGLVSPAAILPEGGDYLGTLSELDYLLSAYKASEIIFCAADISAKETIAIMEQLGASYQYKIVQPNIDSIIGSNSKDGAGDLYAVGISFALNRPTERRSKRLLDFALSFIFLMLSPILFIFVAEKAGFLANLFAVLSGRATFVAYSAGAHRKGLPKLPPSILQPADRLPTPPTRAAIAAKLDSLYAKEYNIYQDLQIILRRFRQLGRARK